MTRRRLWRPQLTEQELSRGRVFFALYILVFPAVMGLIQWVFTEKWAFFLSAGAYGLMYHYFSAVMTLLVFWSFLKNSFFILLDWLPENLFAFLTGLLGWLILQVPFGFIPFPVENLEHLGFAEQYGLSPGATTVIVVVLMPIVEEMLFRGLVFGGLRRYGRPLAYAASILLFSFYHVYQFALIEWDARYLLLMVAYLPMGAALTWCYDNGGSVWSSMALHAAISGITLRFLL